MLVRKLRFSKVLEKRFTICIFPFYLCQPLLALLSHNLVRNGMMKIHFLLFLLYIILIFIYYLSQQNDDNRIHQKKKPIVKDAPIEL